MVGEGVGADGAGKRDGNARIFGDAATLWQGLLCCTLDPPRSLTISHHPARADSPAAVLRLSVHPLSRLLLSGPSRPDRLSWRARSLAVLAFALVVALPGCATRGERAARVAAAKPMPPVAWPLVAVAQAHPERVLLTLGADQQLWLATPPVLSAWSAARRLLIGSSEPLPGLALVSTPTPNAYVMRHDESGIVVVTLGMVDLLGDDEAAWAALFGHELAHLRLRHSEQRGQRRETGEGVSAALGFALTLAGIPFAPLFADATTVVVERGYSREDERAADREGMAAMVRAGYDPAGAVRLFEKLSALGGTRVFGFLDTHPAGAERLDAARRAAGEVGGGSDPGDPGHNR